MSAISSKLNVVIKSNIAKVVAALSLTFGRLFRNFFIRAYNYYQGLDLAGDLAVLLFKLQDLPQLSAISGRFQL